MLTRFSLGQLEAFYWVARLGSFHAAASHLLLSQPSVTSRIHKLEDAIETTLFDRSNYRPHLTTEGESVLRYAQQILELAGKIQSFQGIAASPDRLFRLGIADSTAMTRMSRLLHVFENKFNNLWIDLTIDYSSRLNTLLAEGKLDLAVMTEPDYSPDIRAVPINTIELCWATSSRSPLIEGPLRPQDLINHRLVTNPSPSNLYHSTIDWFGSAGLRPEHISTCNTLQGTLQLIAYDFAIGLVPAELLNYLPAPLGLKALNALPEIKPHSLCICYNHSVIDQTLQAVIAELGNILCERPCKAATDNVIEAFNPTI